MKRGIRNNNPLNIRHSQDQWEGMRKKKCTWSSSYKPLDIQPFRIELPIESDSEPRDWDEYWDWSAGA